MLWIAKKCRFVEKIAPDIWWSVFGPLFTTSHPVLVTDPACMFTVFQNGIYDGPADAVAVVIPVLENLKIGKKSSRDPVLCID
jgi:hypothetical protein